MIATLPDPILERAKAANPPTREELEADAAVEVAEAQFNAFLLAQRRTQRDLGASEGFVTGFIEMDDRRRGDYEAVRSDLERALIRRNALQLARNARVQMQADAENAKAAAEWQKQYQRDQKRAGR